MGFQVRLCFRPWCRFLQVVIVVERFSSSALLEAVVEGFFEIFPWWMFSSSFSHGGGFLRVVDVFFVFRSASGHGEGFP